MNFFNRWFEKTGDVLFPRSCVACKKEGALLCSTCFANWNTTHLSSEDLKGGDIGKQFWTFAYADPIARELICSWKYYFDATAWSILQAKILPSFSNFREVIRSERIEAFIPVPLHDQRFCERGFDQAETLARFLAQELGCACRPLLVRERNTGKQAERTPEERCVSMQENPFSALPFSVPKNLILIDDVWTTGSTASAAASALRARGAEKIFIYTIAKG
ncbi:MAG: phosphoribosyltransferase family protein [Patescibacteria group bacterium]|jgi:ComF family protein